MKNQNYRKNKLIELWQAGQKTINGWLALPDGSCSEAMAHAGWDSLTIDMQHGLVDYQDALNMLRGISTTETVPMVRVPWLDEGIIMKMLDAGTYGIICPMINTADDAARLAKACRYPPRGVRSTGPVRASLYGGADYAKNADDTVLCFAMIETLEAVKNLESILAVKEINGIYIGPSDLSLAHGYQPGFDREEPQMLEVITSIISRVSSNRKFLGIHCGSVAYGRRMLGLGANFITVGSDMRFVSAGAKAVVGEFREG
jgi:4-hydroxy-2-oxoheptanedioate aldolase